MKTRQEMIYDFMMAAMSGIGIKVDPRADDGFDISDYNDFAEAAYQLATYCADVYLERCGG